MRILRNAACAFACLVLATGYASAKEIHVATDATFMPFEYVENGKMTGFDIELVDALAKKMGDTVKWTQIDFKGLIPGLVAKRFDAAVSAIYITDARKKVVDFTDSYYPGGLVILVKKDDNAIDGPDSLAGKKVSVQIGTKSVDYLSKNYPKAQLTEVEKNEQMFDLLLTGRVDAVVTGKPAAIVFAKAHPDVKIVGKQVTVERYGMAVRKDLPELTTGLNKALAEAKKDGTYQALVHKWFEAN